MKNSLVTKFMALLVCAIMVAGILPVAAIAEAMPKGLSADVGIGATAPTSGWTQISSASHICGYKYVTSISTGKTYIIANANTASTTTARYALCASSDSTSTSTTRQEIHIISDSNGDLWIADTSNNKITDKATLYSWNTFNSTSGTLILGKNAVRTAYYLYNNGDGKNVALNNSGGHGLSFSTSTGLKLGSYFMQYVGGSYNRFYTVSSDSYTMTYPFEYVDYGYTYDLYAAMSGPTAYTVPSSFTAEQAQALVKQNLNVWLSDVTASAHPDAYLTYDYDLTYTASTGKYVFTVKYQNETLGSITVNLSSDTPALSSIVPNEATVYVGAAGSTDTGSTLNLSFSGTVQGFPITVDMLVDEEGNQVSTANTGDYEKLYILFNGVKYGGSFTLHVVSPDYPAYPEDGSVIVDKNGSGIDWYNTGLANVELSATGVPISKGIDIVIMLDTSSSMSEGNREPVLRQSLHNLIKTLSTPINGAVPDVRVAIADFNGHVADGKYAWNTGNLMSGDDKANLSPEGYCAGAKVYTGINAGEVAIQSESINYLDSDAFVQACGLAGSYFDNIVIETNRGTNYDYGLGASYELVKAIQEKNAADGVDREQYVIFMSDGGTHQYNYYGISYNLASSSTDYSAPIGYWHNWVLGSGSYTLSSTTYSHFYNSDANKNWYAEAIKGTGDCEIINMNLTSASPVCMETVQGLGVKIYSIGFCLTADDDLGLTKAEIGEVLERISSGDGYYYSADAPEDLDGVFDQIANNVLVAGTNAYFVDTIGNDYVLQTAEHMGQQQSIQVKRYKVYKSSDVGKTIDNVYVTVDMIGQRYGTPTVLETVTFSSDGKQAYSDQLGGNSNNILGTDGIIRAKYFYFNNNVSGSVEIQPENNVNTSVNAPGIMAAGDVIYSCGFESSESPGDTWSFKDSDSDGYNWDLLSDSAEEAHTGEGLVYSASFINYVGALTPDNWLISPEITIPANGALLSFYMAARDTDYPGDKVGVYVTTDGGTTWSSELGLFTAPTSYTNYSVDLNAYAGETIKVALRHYDSEDIYQVLIDDFVITEAEGGTTDPVEPITGEYYTPVDTISTSDTYMIGFVVDGEVYVIMNYNPSMSNNYYYSSGSVYYGYTAKATVDSNGNITAVSGWTTDPQYCTWTFSSTSGGSIKSTQDDSRYLRAYSTSNYDDLYPSTSTSWNNWYYSDHTLSYQVSSSVTKYACYMPTIGSYSNFCYAPATPSSTYGYVQLYKYVEGGTDDPNDLPTYDLPAQTFYWLIGDITQEEVALSYNVYLKDSIVPYGSANGNLGSCPTGIYPTNEEAILHYTNYLNHSCALDTVSPELPWGSAVVNYAFYYVDENGTPIVNLTSGQTGGFANRVIASDNTLYKQFKRGESVRVSASALAESLGYTLYDASAAYTVTAANGSDVKGKWTIEIGEGKNRSTYVTGYSSGSAASNELVMEAETYEYSNTTVWFAVIYKVGATADAVVLDYGLPVSINVLDNDLLSMVTSKEIVGIGFASNMTAGQTDAPLSGFSTTMVGNFGTAKVADAARGIITYTLDNSKSMNFKAPETLAYAVQCADGTDSSGNTKYIYHYAALTVIPATTVYYEDNFITFTPGKSTTVVGENATTTDITWKEQSGEDPYQSQDRPGASGNPFLDADNAYGYDPAYDGCSEYSMGGSHYVTVDGKTTENPTASFTFWGTGFDIISKTSTDSGIMIVEIENADTDASVDCLIVDTYYGYTYNDGIWTPTPTTEAAVWQVPVIKRTGLSYGHYRVNIIPVYNEVLDHNPDNTGYTVYIDAVRIYDPVDVSAGTDDANRVANVYALDGEANPDYETVRNFVFNQMASAPIGFAPEKFAGGVFIDGAGEVIYSGNFEYTNPSPNNEIYLAPGQAVYFKLRANVDPTNERVMIGIKLAIGKNGSLALTQIQLDDDNNVIPFDTITIAEVATATDMYYSLGNITWKPVTVGETTYYETNGLVLANTSSDGNIISLTNLKISSYDTSVDINFADNITAASDVNELLAGDSALIVPCCDSDEAIAAAEYMNYNYGSYTLGDVNGDGEIDMLDTLITLRHTIGLAELKGAKLKAADMDGNGVIDAIDVMHIMRYVMENK